VATQSRYAPASTKSTVFRPKQIVSTSILDMQVALALSKTSVLRGKL
jgi:hypothetical protein